MGKLNKTTKAVVFQSLFVKRTCDHDLLKHPELSRCLEADEVHAPLSAEVSSVEPVPVLELVPGFPPRQEVVVVAHFTVRNTLKNSLYLNKRFSIFIDKTVSLFSLKIHFAMLVLLK